MVKTAVLENVVTSSARAEAALVGLGDPVLDVKWEGGSTGAENLVKCVRALIESAKQKRESYWWKGCSISGKSVSWRE